VSRSRKPAWVVMIGVPSSSQDVILARFIALNNISRSTWTFAGKRSEKEACHKAPSRLRWQRDRLKECAVVRNGLYTVDVAIALAAPDTSAET